MSDRPSSPPPTSEPDPSALTCSSSEAGPCAKCQRKTHKYGARARGPLCSWWREALAESGGLGVPRAVSSL